MNYSQEQSSDVRRSVEAIKVSPGFANSPQLQNFLSFIVEKTIAGETSDIKGYTIGVDALGRHPDFDPTTDPSVRVMAGRLRQALVNYYRDTEDQPAVTISLEKGSYVPVFTFETCPAIEPTPDPAGRKRAENKKGNLWTYGAGVALVVMATVLLATNARYGFFQQNSSYSGSVNLPAPNTISIEQTRIPSLTIDIETDEAGIPDWISPEELKLRALIAFSRFREYRVYDVTAETDKTSGNYFEADYALRIFFTRSDNGDDLEAFVKLDQPTTGKIVWSGDFVFPQPVGNQEEVNRDVIERTVTELMSPYGILYRDIADIQTNGNRLRCMTRIYSYFMRESLQAFSDGLQCAQKLVDSGVASSSIHAFLSFMYVEAYRRDYRTGKDNPLRVAEQLADQAIQLDPANARAFQARFAVEKSKGSLNPDKVNTAVEDAVSLNPVDRDIAGDVAAYFIASNELELAEPYLSRALSLTPVPPAWLNFYNYLFADLSGNYPEADAIAEKLDARQSSLVAFAALLAADRRHNEDQKEAITAIILEMEPALLTDTASALQRRGFDNDLADSLAKRVTDMNLNTGKTTS
ncbi:MAG: hypothetical protein AAGA76_06115 [Pseudomonadota bacterium]